MPSRVAIAWSLLLVLVLLLGLLFLVVAFGVVRHLRRQRHRREQEQGLAHRGRTNRDFDPDDADAPGRHSGHFRRTDRPEDEDEE